MTNPAPKTAQRAALIIGVTGSFGGHAAVALIKHGWRIRALARDPEAAKAKTGAHMPIDWVKGDGMVPADVIAAAQGVQVIVHAGNPPAYRNWAGTVVPMLKATLAAAEQTGARIVLPASVYNFAPDSGAMIPETAPQAPVTRKGRIRVEIEEILRAASLRGVRTLVIRAGDFFGPAAPNSALGWLTVRAKGRVRSVYRAGPRDVGHCWAYLPDMAEATARLLDHEARLAAFDVFHFAGHWLERGDEMGASVRRVTHQPRLPIRAFPYLVVYALAPFVETMREMIEMRYLWARPIGLDNSKLVRFLGEEPHTPLDQAVRATVADMGCLGEIELAQGFGATVAA
jgi:nucleoside-diphosphate-sugar epimerase